MAGTRARGEAIRQFILEQLREHPHDIVAIASEKFEISRQAVHKHLRWLQRQGDIEISGSSRKRLYSLVDRGGGNWIYQWAQRDRLAEDVVWDSDISSKLKDLPENVRDIWFYCFCEIFNNAVDHSGGNSIMVTVKKTAIDTRLSVIDDGIGIFEKLKQELGLTDVRHAVLELAKGKVTTDPDNHSGQGIFFTSRMLDWFAIFSGKITFSHSVNAPEDWISDDAQSISGTYVAMRLSNNTQRTAKGVFDRFSSGDDYGFTKTVVPLHMAQYGEDKLVSRSQARRVVAGLDKFKIIYFDFEGVESIGQAFADEIFRVFQRRHPELELLSANANSQVKQFISRAKADVS